jgi:hypothetical protein
MHSSMQQVPFMMDINQLPQMGFEPNGVPSANESVNKFRDCITAGFSEAIAVLVKAKDNDRPGTGAPEHLFKIVRSATYYNALNYIKVSPHGG